MTGHAVGGEIELKAQIIELQQRLAALERGADSQSVSIQGVAASAPPMAEPIGRRALLRRVGTVAAGAAAASVVGGMLRPAAAGVGINGNMQIGNANISTTANTPQTLLKVSSLASGDSAVFAVSDGSTATSTRRAAIVGAAGTQLDTGVAGIVSGTSGVGVLGQGPIGLLGASNNVHIKLTDASGGFSLLPTTAALLASTAAIGQIVLDRSENLWLGSSGGWKKLAGPTSAGAFHIITPARVYDSRSASKLTGGLTRLIPIIGGSVPTGAKAVMVTLTLTNTDGPSGFLTMTAGNVGSTAASSINWFAAGQNLATTVVSELDSLGRVKMFNNSGSGTDFIIDVTGYYL